MVPEKSLIIVLDKNSDICIADNDKYTKYTRHISRLIHFLENGKKCNFHKTVWCKGSMQLSDIVTTNVRED